MKKVLAVFMVMLILMGGVAVAVSAAPLRVLDLAFVVDTTGSMSSHIRRAKADMKEYLDDLDASGMDYRVAIVDYRDFPERTHDKVDYPYRVQLDFSSDYDTILAGIEKLSVDGGGDWRETVYSALIDGVNALSWRPKAGKAAILIGDAPALDPEPISGYTADDAISSLKTGGIAKKEDPMTMTKGTVSVDQYFAPQADARSAVTLFAIATNNDSEVVRCFEYLTEDTNGITYTLSGSQTVSDIIEEIIEVIPEVVEPPQPTLWERLKAFFLKVWYIITLQWSKLV